MSNTDWELSHDADPRCANCGEVLEGRKRKFCTRECQTAALRNDRLNTSIRFDHDLHDRMQQWCDATGLPLNWLVNRLCHEGMDTIIASDEFRLTERIERTDREEAPC